MSVNQAMTGAGSTTRRALFAGAGAVGATAVLAACGGGDEPSAGQTSAPAGTEPGTTPTDGAAEGGVTVGTTSDIPVGGGVIFAGQGVVVTQPTAGEFKAFSSICSHQRCPVTSVDGGTINCSCHMSRFSIENGAPNGGPATQPLDTKQVTVQGDNVVVS